ncbi:MAG: CbrC family protein [Anaerolineales bacterium]
MELPFFKYHPEPLRTGSVRPSQDKCKCCGQIRGYIYIGPVYARQEYLKCICPWCIADGSAHKKFNAEFTDSMGIGGFGRWEKVSELIIEEIVSRTPGFASWQSENWFTHCGDAAAFLGPVGYKELKEYGVDAIEAIRISSFVPENEWEQYLKILDKDGSPVAFLFKCLHCGMYGGYVDVD